MDPYVVLLLHDNSQRIDSAIKGSRVMYRLIVLLLRLIQILFPFIDKELIAARSFQDNHKRIPPYTKARWVKMIPCL